MLLKNKNLNINHTDNNVSFYIQLLKNGKFKRKIAFLYSICLQGWTPLHVASIHNDLEMVKTLVHKGAFVNTKDFSLNTPLTFARQNSAREVANYLRKNGAKEFNQKQT